MFKKNYIDVSRDQHAADELIRRSGQMGVPLWQTINPKFTLE